MNRQAFQSRAALSFACLALGLAATPGQAVDNMTLFVNTASYGDVFDNSLSLQEAMEVAYSGPQYRCWTAGEVNQMLGVLWALVPPNCWLPTVVGYGANTDDIIRFADGMTTIQTTANDMSLSCGDTLDGQRSDAATTHIDFNGHTGLDLRCADLGRPDMTVANLVLDHAAFSGISGTGLHGAQIVNVKVSDSGSDGLALTTFNGTTNPRRIQVRNSTFVRNAGRGIRIEATTGISDDPADHEITIVGNFVGLESLTDGAANGNALGGVRVVNSRRVKVGGTVSQRNVISGNGGKGLELSGPGLVEAKVLNNWLGIRGTTGSIARGNAGNGIQLSGGASANKIGEDSGTGNVVSGNGNDGITIDGSGTEANSVVGNTVGLNAARTGALPNAWSGVAIFGGARFNTIGTQTAKNVIAGNGGAGVYIADSGTDSNEVRYNWIGQSATNLAIANGGGGVLVTAGTHGSRIGPGNVISGNSGPGVEIAGSGTLAALVDNNTIGLNAAGTVQLPNSSHGVLVHTGAVGTEISANTVSRNLGDCIRLADAGTNGGQVLGNWLTNCAGDGLSIQGAGGTMVGGLADGSQPNNMQGNGGAAVRVQSGVGNQIRGNGMVANLFEIAHGSPGTPPGFAANDALDADTGGNLQQNSPVFVRAITSPTAWIGVGVLYSAPNTQFLIDYYGGGCGADGRGEPSYYLASQNVTTNAQGFADVSAFAGVHVTQSHFMATATDPAGNTSQISPCRAFGEPANLVFDDGFESGFVDGWSSWARPQFP